MNIPIEVPDGVSGDWSVETFTVEEKQSIRKVGVVGVVKIKERKDGNMNRIEASIKAMEIRLALLEKEGHGPSVEEMERTLNITDFREYESLQTLKSIASVEGILTLEEAESVYNYLGNTMEHFNKQSIAVKLILTKLHQELMAKKMKGAL